MSMTKRPKLQIEEFALAVTRFVGSLQSILLHTTLFLISFVAVWLGVLPFDRMLLVLTTVVSLEAIYLSIFIQMTINLASASIQEVEQDIDEIQEDIDEIQENVGEIQEDVEEMTEEDKEEEESQKEHEKTLQEIRAGLENLMKDIEKLQKRS